MATEKRRKEISIVSVGRTIDFVLEKNDGQTLRIDTPTVAMTATMAAACFRALSRARRSTRRFQTDRIIPGSVLTDVLETTLTSPSGFNLQPTHIQMVQCNKIKEKLSQNAMLGAGNQFRVRDASVLAVFLADLEVGKRINRIVQLETDAGMRDANYMAVLPVASSFLTGEGHAATLAKKVATDVLSQLQPMPSVEPIQAWSYKNASLMAQTYVLAATSHGLGTCIMEGFDMRRVKEILRVPDRYDIPLLVATGYDYEEATERTPRLSMEEVVFGDTFGEPFVLASDENEEATKQTDSNDVGIKAGSYVEQ